MLITDVSEAAEFYVAPGGSDSNPGTKIAPLATLDGARQLIAAREIAGSESVTVHVADGVYYLPETLVFTPGDSGSAENPIVFRAQTEGGAILSGGSKLELS